MTRWRMNNCDAAESREQSGIWEHTAPTVTRNREAMCAGHCGGGLTGFQRWCMADCGEVLLFSVRR